MKTKTILLSLAVLVAACKGNDHRQFLNGTFVNSAKGAMSIADDTLQVESVDGLHYNIHRSTGFKLIREGKTGGRQFEREEWKAVFDQQTQTMRETRKGKLISIYPDSGFILIGKRKYIKQ